MTLDELANNLTILTAGTFAIGFILFLLALRLFRRSRGGNYWIHRRKAGRRGFRVLILAVGFLSMSAALCVASFVFDTLDKDQNARRTPDSSPQALHTETLSQSITPSPTLSPTASLSPTDLPASTPSPEEGSPSPEPSPEASSSSFDLGAPLTATSTPEGHIPSPTLTLTATLTPSLTSTTTATPSLSPTPVTPTATLTPSPFPTRASVLIPLTPRASASNDASLEIAAISTEIDDEWQVLNPSIVFMENTTRLYFFLKFSQMSSGVLWQWHLLKDGDYVDGQSSLWGNQTQGHSFFFYSLEGGFSAGEYEIQLYLGDQQVDSATFSIISAS